MKKKLTVALLGCGNRGNLFAEKVLEFSDKYEIAAICDFNKEQMERLHKRFGLDNVSDFDNTDEFFKEKRADIIIIATHDHYHVEQALKALELGYDMLLEKPISDNRDELLALLEAKNRTGKNVTVCHELRYGYGYRKCAEILKSGILGKLYAIDASERVAYWHYTQAYIRCASSMPGLWYPFILAKCSHDLDLIQSYAGSRCESVSAVGGLDFFLPQNAPEGAADRCLECKYVDTCPYSAKRIYIDGWYQAGKPEQAWPYTKVVRPTSSEDAIRCALNTGCYGTCVFKCKVDGVVDHEYVQMQFENGIKASLKMVYSATPGRRYVFYGTYGEMILDEREDTIVVMPFGAEKQVIHLGVGDGHGGGDSILINELYDIVTNQAAATTTLEESIESHLIGIAAEESRQLGGTAVSVHR